MIKEQHILVDTCIISYLLSNKKELVEQTKEYLDQLMNNNNKLAISNFSVYEILRNIDPNKRDEAEEILDRFIQVDHNEERQKRATLLYSAYENDSKIKSKKHSISDIDIFIGSLIFTKDKPYLLTADYCDFPRPFFVESSIKRIEYKEKNGNRKCIYYYLLEPNLESIF